MSFKKILVLCGAFSIIGCAHNSSSTLNAQYKEIRNIQNEEVKYYDILTSIDEDVLPIPEIDIQSTIGIEDTVETSEYYEEFKEFNVPMAMTGRVNAYIKYHVERVPAITQAWLNRANKYMYLVKDIFIQEGLPSDLVVLALTESGYNPHAVSHAGATGMWQFMYRTGIDYGMDINFWVDERKDFEKSTRAAAKYLKSLYYQFNDWYLALAAYNAGPGRMARAIKKHKTNDFFKISSRNTLKLETRDYVPKFLAQLIIFKNYLKYGFSAPEDMPMLFSSIEAPSSTNLYWLANKLNVDYKVLKDLNPGLKYPITPPTKYKIRVPYNMDKDALAYLNKASSIERSRYIVYTGKKGENVGDIAEKHKVLKSDILKLNGMKREYLYSNRPVLIPVEEYSNNMMDVVFAELLGKIDPKYYKVRKGDTFIGIAHKHNMRMGDLQRINPNVKPSRIFPGQYIAVTKDGYVNKKYAVRKSKKSVANIKYRIRNGDSLWGIAKKFNTTVASIKKYNNINGNFIKAGKVITIKRK